MATAVPEDSIPVCQYIVTDEELIPVVMDHLFRYIATPDTAAIRSRIGQRYVTAVRMIFYVESSASDTSTHVQSETWDDIPVIMPQSSESDDAISDETVLNEMD